MRTPDIYSNPRKPEDFYDLDTREAVLNVSQPHLPLWLRVAYVSARDHEFYVVQVDFYSHPSEFNCENLIGEDRSFDDLPVQTREFIQDSLCRRHLAREVAA